MANVIKTVMTYPLNGSTRDFNIPFEYLARKFVQVTLLGKDRKVLVLNTDYRFSTKTTITTTQAWGTAQGYTQIEIRRYTSATERLVDFTDGSILRAYDLNIAQIQTMHVAEEARDLTADTIGVNNEGHLDARGRRIVNLANAVSDRDAVPLGQLKTMNQNSWQARNEAQQFRNEAQTFRNNAETFKNEANSFKNQAAASQTAAKTSETNAKNSENAAAASKNAAAQSQAAARTSETNAANSANSSKAQADLAQKWASNPQGAVVANNEYSAKHYALTAKAEADKLSNWNALAGAIDSVSGTTVTFKGQVSTASAVIRGGAEVRGSMTVGGSSTIKGGIELIHSTPFIDFHHGNSTADYTSRLITTDASTLTLNNNFTAGGNIYAKGQLIGNNQMSIMNPRGNIGFKVLHAQNDPSAGSWASRSQWIWYDDSVELGAVRGNSKDISYLALRLNHAAAGPVSGSNYAELSIRNNLITMNRQLQIMGNAVYQSDGNIKGSLWGTTLWDWMRNNTVVRLQMGAVQSSKLWKGPGISDGGSKVVTGVVNGNQDDLPDTVQWRVLQFVRNNGTAYNVY